MEKLMASFVLFSPVTFAHDKIKRAENGDGVADHVAGHEGGKDAEIAKRGRADFQAVRRAAAFAVDVKAQLALGILRAKKDFAGRRVDALGDEDELVNQFF